MKIQNIALTLIMAFAVLLFFQVNNVQAQKGQFKHSAKIFDKLTEEQRQAIHQKVDELRDEGVSREDIHKAVVEMLKGYGVEIPEDFKMMPAPGSHPFMGWFDDQLTDEQRTELHEKIDQLRKDNASPEEIRNTIKETLKSYGVELPHKDFGGKEKGRNGWNRGFMNDSSLTAEQKSAIQLKIKDMREQGAGRKEIHDTVREMLKSYGVQPPESDDSFRGERGFGMMGFMRDLNLTKEQRTAIKNKIQELRKQDADRETIHKEINKMLQEYGVQVPEEVEQRQQLMESLNDEQQMAIHKKIREMRRDGASREEIDQTVRQMAEEFKQASGDESENGTVTQPGESGIVTISNFPNPFNPETTIRYELQKAAQVKVSIYNEQGQLIRELENKYLQPGSYTINWDGHNNTGQMTPSGVYFLKINAGGETFSHRLILTK